MNAQIVIVCIGSLFAAAAVAGAPSEEDGQNTQSSTEEEVRLTSTDLDQITAYVLERNPLLSSSPGIKFASGQRAWSVETSNHILFADVIYLPHTETAGLKQAFQVSCQQQAELWTCTEAEIRAYLQLETQDFEVRVKGGIGSDEALALIAATRSVAMSSAAEGSASPETAVMIWPERDRILVSWGSPEGYQDVVVQARLKQNGDPANANDWQADTYNPSY